MCNKALRVKINANAKIITSVNCVTYLGHQQRKCIINSHSIITFHNLSLTIITHSERVKNKSVNDAREVDRTAAGLREKLQGPSQEKFISTAGRTVSIIDHGEIVREDLNGRSALAAANCNGARADCGDFLLNLTSIASLRAHAPNPSVPPLYFHQ